MTRENVGNVIVAAIAACERGDTASAQALLFPYFAGTDSVGVRRLLGDAAYTAVVEFYLYTTDGDMTKQGRTGGFSSLADCLEDLKKTGVVASCSQGNLSRQEGPKYEPLTAIAVCLALCQVELEMLRTGHGKDARFDAFTIIREPMKEEDIDQYKDSQEAQLARDALQLFRCLNDWLSIFWVSPVTPADIEEKATLLGHLRMQFERLSQDSTHAASRQR